MDGRGTVPNGNEEGVWMGGAQYPMEMREGCGWEGYSTLWK